MPSATLHVMMEAAKKAGRALARDFGELENLQVSRKGPGDFVTQADLRTEKILHEELEYARPGYGFLMEESGLVEGSDATHRWIIDPLDGTTNFMHAIAHFAISIALQREETLVAGVVYDPITGDAYHAERGEGAFLNNRRLRVATRTHLDEAVLGIGHGISAQEAAEFNIAGLRRFGAAALDLAFVAAGRLDGFWARGLAPWDMAAGIVLVREAGGMVSDFDNKDGFLESGAIVAANDTIHRAMRTRIS